MSEIKLNIYDRETKELVKTYTTDSVELMFGTVEDILSVVDIEKISSKEKEELVANHPFASFAGTLIVYAILFFQNSEVFFVL